VSVLSRIRVFDLPRCSLGPPRSLLLAAALICASPLSIRAQEPGPAPAREAQEGQEPSGPTAAVTGRVVDQLTGEPIEGAAVELVGVAGPAFTDEAGAFSLRGFPPGVYDLSVQVIGYAPYLESNVIVGSGKPLSLTVRLAARPVELAPLEVQASYFRRPQVAGPGTRTLSSVDTRRAPGVNEDVVRSVALLPGVGVTSGGRNDLIVRGGAPYENLFLVDGIEVPNINHFGSQGSTGGPLSMINIEFVEETRFSNGGFGARYGDRTASVTDITLREGNADRLSGTVNLSATGFGAILEGPLGDRANFLFSARRSYLDLIFRAAGFSFIPSYWDFQTKAVFRPDPLNTLSFLFIGALNDLDFNNEDDEDRYDNSRILSPNNRQYFGGFTWEHGFGGSRLAVTLGRTFTRFRTTQTDFLGASDTLFANRSSEGENSLRVEWSGQPSSRLDLTLGTVVRYASDLDYEVEVPGELRLDDSGQPAPLGLRYDLGPSSSIFAAGGRYYQPPSYIWLIGDSANPERLEPMRADQAVLGFEVRPRRDVKVQLEGFYKWYGDYPARVFRPQAVLAPSGFEDATDDIPFGLEPLTSVATGRVFGGEAFVQKKLSAVPVYGLLSLSVARAEFTSLEGKARSGRYDTRFIGTALAGYRFNPKWEVSGKLRVATGLPTTPFIETGPDTGRRDYTRYNEGDRFPTFHALDIRVDRRFSFRGWQLEVYVDVQNVYGRQNFTGVRWDFRTDEPEFDESLGVLPTLGVNVEF
jgi:hypothetical protein